MTSPQPETAASATAPDEKLSPADTVYAIGEVLRDLDPGPLAELRRMEFDQGEVGAPYFWRFNARFGWRELQRPAWARIVQAMAILTDKGRVEKKDSPHSAKSKANSWRGFGTALCDGGDPHWLEAGATPRPVYSEDRLARLLATRGEAARGEALLRSVRLLAATKPAGIGVDCTDIACFLLDPDNPEPGRRIAKDYYDKLDHATRQHSEQNNSEGDDE
jgi:CRISPR system Cascade subunit CasB